MSDNDLTQRVAAAMWKAEATDSGTPQSVIDARTPEAFAEQSEQVRKRWAKFARAALPAVSAPVAVRVKPLEWKEHHDGNHRKGEVFSTRSPVSFAPIAAHKKHDGWWLNVDCKTYPTLEAAKAAAQADYAARIMAAIDVVDVAELVEAAEGLHRAVCGDTGFVAAVRADSGLAYPWPALDAAEERLAAALAKIKEPQHG